jgi:formamidopyrimidine-DNA glycosylase
MPELPEVETVRRDLERAVVGRRIVDVNAPGARTVRRTSAAAVEGGLRGRVLVGARRRGKYLLGDLDDGGLVVVHLRMSGQLLLAPGGSERPRHTHVVCVLEGGDELRFVDPRTFGEVVVTRPERLASDLPGVASLGWDPLIDPMTPARFDRMVRRRRRRLKALLCDQHVVAGIGNIYSDEILWLARLRYDRRSDTLSAREVGRLRRAIPAVLGAAVAARGSSLADAQYVDLFGRTGAFQHEHRVHARAGQACPRCGRRIERQVDQGRSTYLCPRCQP